MSLVRYDPWELLNDFRGELNRVFGADPAAGHDARSAVPTIPAADWMPAVDIEEAAENFIIRADVPGVNIKDIDVTIDNGVLSIRGERRRESEEHSDRYKRTERSYGTFLRRLTLPHTVDGNKVSAKVRDGVLEVTVPKSEVSRPLRIEVGR